MTTAKYIAILIGGMVLSGTVVGAVADAGPQWLATGTVTKIDGSTFYFLGKDNVIYTIDAAGSEVLVEDFDTDCYSLRVGDTVRVYGNVVAQGTIRAVRVRIFGREQQTAGSAGAGPSPEKEIKIIIEKRAPEPLEPTEPPAGRPVEPRCPPNWEGRGLITGIDYTGHRVKIQSPCGNYSIDVGDALLTDGRYRIGLGRLNTGDAVKVTGVLMAHNEVAAERLDVARTYSEAQNAVPLLPISALGVIQQVDYASFTFKMGTRAGAIVVAADERTVIQQHQDDKLAFSALRPGMRVKMSGYGSLATGYAAQHIQIIGISP